MRIVCTCPDTTGFPHCTADNCKRITPPHPDTVRLNELAAASRRYFEALEAKDKIGPGRWLNLKGAARERTLAKRVTELREAEQELRRLVGANQRLLYIKFHEKKPGMVSRLAIPQSVDFWNHQVEAVWTLYLHSDETAPPPLPYRPVHNKNAFLEDRMHDWNIDNNRQFKYASRVTDEPVWVLIELK